MGIAVPPHGPPGNAIEQFSAAIVSAVAEDNSLVIQQLLLSGLDVDVLLRWRQPDKTKPRKRTLAMVAAYYGSVQSLGLLLSSGADVNKKAPEDGITALGLALQGPSSERGRAVLAVLLQHGATWPANIDSRSLAFTESLDGTIAGVGADSKSDPKGEDPNCPLRLPECCTDEFRMYHFKVVMCTNPERHDWTTCPFKHPGEKACRRDPTTHSYDGTPCPDFRKGVCKRGDACPYGHGVFECHLHPTRYRTLRCKHGLDCKHLVCFFAHTDEQLRVTDYVPPAASTSNSSASSDQGSEQSGRSSTPSSTSSTSVSPCSLSPTSSGELPSSACPDAPASQPMASAVAPAQHAQQAQHGHVCKFTPQCSSPAAATHVPAHQASDLVSLNEVAAVLADLGLAPHTALPLLMNRMKGQNGGAPQPAAKPQVAPHVQQPHQRASMVPSADAALPRYTAARASSVDQQQQQQAVARALAPPAAAAPLLLAMQSPFATAVGQDLAPASLGSTVHKAASAPVVQQPAASTMHRANTDPQVDIRLLKPRLQAPLSQPIAPAPAATTQLPLAGPLSQSLPTTAYPSLAEQLLANALSQSQPMAPACQPQVLEHHLQAALLGSGVHMAQQPCTLQGHRQDHQHQQQPIQGLQLAHAHSAIPSLGYSHIPIQGWTELSHAHSAQPSMGSGLFGPPGVARYSMQGLGVPTSAAQSAFSGLQGVPGAMLGQYMGFDTDWLAGMVAKGPQHAAFPPASCGHIQADHLIHMDQVNPWAPAYTPFAAVTRPF